MAREKRLQDKEAELSKIKMKIHEKNQKLNEDLINKQKILNQKIDYYQLKIQSKKSRKSSKKSRKSSKKKYRHSKY